MRHFIYRAPLALIAIVAVLVAVTHVSAIEVASNLTQFTPASHTISPGSSFPVIANSFTTGPGLWNINSITARLVEPDRVPGTSLQLEILANNGGVPGTTVVGTLDMTANDVGNAGNYPFPPTAPLQLSGNTTYWLAAIPSPANVYLWTLTNSPNDNGILGWSLGDAYFSSANGVAWGATGGFSLLMSIDATSVPEPSTVALTVLALTVLPSRRRRPTSHNCS